MQKVSEVEIVMKVMSQGNAYLFSEYPNFWYKKILPHKSMSFHSILLGEKNFQAIINYHLIFVSYIYRHNLYMCKEM